MQDKISLENENQEVARRLDSLGKKILGAARDELYLGMRFLDVALSRFICQMDTEVQLFGTDGAILYFHPRQLGGYYRQNRILVNRGYLHMVYHCLFRHMWKEYPEALPDEAAGGARLWDLSCDIAAEYLIDGNLHRSVRFSRSLLRRETYRRLEQEGKTLHAEQVWKCLRARRLQERELTRLEQEFLVDDHRFWANHRPEQKPDSSMLQQRWKEIEEQIETELETFSKEASEKSGELLGVLRVENRESQDYRTFLRKFSVLREEMEVDIDTFDYAFYSYGLSLYGNMPLIEPQETKEVKRVEEFVIALDTSMSCSRELVQKFLEETYAILCENESFFRKVNVHILQCDESVQSDIKITCEKDLKDYMEAVTLYGEGGTDFRPVFAYIDDLLRQGEFEDLRGLIYFTDGYGIYPQRMPSYQTAFIFMEEDYSDAEVHAWAMKIVCGAEPAFENCQK